MRRHSSVIQVAHLNNRKLYGFRYARLKGTSLSSQVVHIAANSSIETTSNARVSALSARTTTFAFA